MANEIITDAGIITVDGSLDTIVIAGDTYTGTAYAQGAIAQALSDKNVVAAQGVSYENKNLTVTADTTLVADGITMSNGTAGFGGAIADRGYMTVTNGLFSGNRADNDGGAVSIDGTATISGSTFAANSAKRGGAIYVGDTASIAGCTFTGNAASTGGAIYIGAGAEATIKDSVFAKRYDTIYNQGGTVTLEGTIMLAARMDGGSYACSVNGVDLVFVNSEQVSVSNLTETGNLRSLAFHGTQEVSFSDLALTDTSISIKCGLPDPGTPVTVATGISSLGNGAITVNGSIARDGIVFVDGVFCTVGLDDNNLQVRRADSVEAAIVCPDFKKGTIGEVTINGVRYSGLVYEDISSASVNSSIVAVQGGTTIYRQTILANNIGVIDNSWFNNATTTVGTGAAINLGNNSKTTITGSTFTICYNNSTHGGAIGAESGAEVTLRSCIFASNTSSGSYGGAIYAGTNSLMTMTGCTFTGNTAAQHAGAIVVDRCGTLDISDCIFAGNIAANGNGGVINLQREGMVTITGCTFTANTAGLARTGNGGAIYAGRDSKLLVSDCVFSGNVVVTDAGAIYTNGTATQTTIKNCIFATKSDSLHLDSGTVTFAGSITLAADLTVKSSYLYYTCSSEKVDFIFINGETISIARLSDTQNIRSIAFTGASPVKFTDLALSDTSISIDCALPALGESLTVAEGLTALGAGNITVHNKNVVGGKAFVEDGLYKVALSGNNLTVEAEEYVSAAIVTSNGVEWLRIGSTNYAGNVYATINEALANEDLAVVQNCSFETRSSVTGSAKRLIADQSCFSKSVVDDDGGALTVSEGLASITGSTFTANAAKRGGAVFSNGEVTIRDSVFATAGDTIYNDGGVLTLGGTIRTAANITSTNAVTVEHDTQLVLELSNRVETLSSQELITDFGTMFGTSQSNLTISVNVASDLAVESYVLAANVSGMTQTEFMVTIDGDAEKSMSITIGKSGQYGPKEYSLTVDAGMLNLSISSIIYVNSLWSGFSEGKEVDIPGGGTAIIGMNAFADLTTAKTMCPLNGKIKFTGGSYSTVMFGGSDSGEVEDIEAKTNLIFLDGTFSKSVFAGNKIQTEEMLQTLSAESSLNIQGGSYSAYVMGGDYLSTTQENVALVNTTGSRTLNISGGEFSGLVAGGSYIAGGTTTLVSQFDGDIDVTIAGGTFNKRIYGGDITDKMANSTTDIIDGNISFTLDASANDININESIVCGSYGYGTVKGDVVFTVKGTADNLTFAGDSVVNGGSGSGYLKVANGKTVKEYDNFVNGTSTAVFDGFSGNFTARLTLFDAISFDNGAVVSLTNAKCNLAELSAWSFAGGASVTFRGGQVNDFTRDTLDIDLTDWDQTTPWTLATGSSDTAFLGFGGFEHVRFDGQDAGYQNGCWSIGDFALSLSESEGRKSMVLAKV